MSHNDIKATTTRRPSVAPALLAKQSVRNAKNIDSERSSLASSNNGNVTNGNPNPNPSKKKKVKKAAQKSNIPDGGAKPNAKGGEKKKDEAQEVAGSLPVSSGLPVLWIRGNDGAMKPLNNVAAAAPSALEPGIAIKAKRGKTLFKTDKEMWEAYSRQQESMALQKPPKAEKAAKKEQTVSDDKSQRKSIFAGIPMAGVKITLENVLEPVKIKEEDINKALIAQNLAMEREKKEREKKAEVRAKNEKNDKCDNSEKNEKEIQSAPGLPPLPLHPNPNPNSNSNSNPMTRTPIVKKKKAAPKSQKAAIINKHLLSKEISRDEYMYHICQPLIMTGFFKTVQSDKQILFGPFLERLARHENRVMQKSKFRPSDSIYLALN